VETMTFVQRGEGLRFQVLAKPRAKKSRIVGEKGGAVEVAIGAPPVEGAANHELIRFLAKTIGVPQSRVVLVRGEGAKIKLIEVLGVTEAEVRKRFFG